MDLVGSLYLNHDAVHTYIEIYKYLNGSSTAGPSSASLKVYIHNR